MSAPQIKNIIFDLSEVLLTGIKDTGIALGEKHKIESPSHHSLPTTHIRTPLLVPLLKEFFHGNVSEDDYVKEVLNTYPQIGTSEWLKNHIRENFVEVEGTREIVLKLRRLGYRLAILSVHTKEWIDYCEEKFDFHGMFDIMIYSYEDKVSKPNPASFQSVLTKFKAKPEECLFIDDSEINTLAAQALGIKSLVFTTAHKLRDDLMTVLPDFS